MQDINFIGIIGALLMTPAVFYSARLILRVLIYLIFNKEKITVTYRDASGREQEKVIYLKRDDEFFSVLDKIAEKKAHEDTRHER
ncbi:hypothetical protein PSI19_00165 [Xenorhabdus khoisanae]|uniref:hypothetical protein n=1 Tax=Xenorhabdus TaxID=626 RepID=UPI0023591F1B|nr:hypothetical protein [Xenorhabdus khoisanae]MDC9612325.1 hypothetical protein [Xenorhabdus khoisanae]